MIVTIAIVLAVAVALIAVGIIGLAILDSHVTDTTDYEDDPDVPLTDWFDCLGDEDVARAERAGEFAEALTAAMQRIEARRGPGRHRAPEPAPTWVLNTQEFDLRWRQLVTETSALTLGATR